MPGVKTTTSTLPGRVATATDESATYFVSGLTERGPIDKAVVVRSLAEFVRRFGDRVTYGFVYDDLHTHFEEGGTAAVVARVVGPAATVGSLTLLDRAGAPANTLRIDAADPGGWSSRLTVQIANGAAANSFTVTVRLDGVVVETWNDLPDPATAVITLAQSLYVRAVNLGSATAAPNNNPAVLAATALTAGTDDRAAVTAARLTASYALFNDDFGTGAVACPGQPASTVGAGLIAHARAHGRIALLAAPLGSSPEAAKVAAATHVGTVGSEFAGLFYPGVLIPVGVGSRTVTPEGYVAAKRAQAILADGPWQPGAGELGIADFVLSAERPIDQVTGDDLDANFVSAIRGIQGTTRVYGWRSLSVDADNYASLSARDTLNLLQAQGRIVLEQYVFKTIDGARRVLSQVHAALIGLADPIAVDGGLYASAEDPGYRVDVGEDVNPIQALQQNRIAARLSARPSPSANLIELEIVKAPLTAAI